MTVDTLLPLGTCTEREAPPRPSGRGSERRRAVKAPNETEVAARSIGCRKPPTKRETVFPPLEPAWLGLIKIISGRDGPTVMLKKVGSERYSPDGRAGARLLVYTPGKIIAGRVMRRMRYFGLVERT